MPHVQEYSEKSLKRVKERLEILRAVSAILLGVRSAYFRLIELTLKLIVTGAGEKSETKYVTLDGGD